MNLLPVWANQHISSRRARLLCGSMQNPELQNPAIQSWPQEASGTHMSNFEVSHQYVISMCHQYAWSQHLKSFLQSIFSRYSLLQSGFLPPPFCFLNDGYFKIYLLIYFWLPSVFMAAHQLFRVVVHGLVLAVASLVVEHGLRIHGLQQLEHMDSRACGVVHRLSCSMAYGIFLDQGWNASPLHWQADSSPLDHQGSPARFSGIFCSTVKAKYILIDPCRKISSSPHFLPGLGKSCHSHTPQSEKWVTHLKWPDFNRLCPIQNLRQGYLIFWNHHVLTRVCHHYYQYFFI